MTPAPMKDDGDWPVMRGERTVRFVCGAVVGLFAGCELAAQVGGAGSAIATVLSMIGVSVAFGIAAAVLGDRFWRGFRW
jgi:hypothetical protein